MYLSWLIGEMDDRIFFLTRYLGIPVSCNSENYSLAGSKVSQIMSESSYFSTESGLNNYGYGLGADLGLFVAKGLIECGKGKIILNTLRKPQSDASYNLPVLMGFGKLYFDPIGGSIAELSSVRRGREVSESWRRMFDFWKLKIPE